MFKRINNNTITISAVLFYYNYKNNVSTGFYVVGASVGKKCPIAANWNHIISSFFFKITVILLAVFFFLFILCLNMHIDSCFFRESSLRLA